MISHFIERELEAHLGIENAPTLDLFAPRVRRRPPFAAELAAVLSGTWMGGFGRTPLLRSGWRTAVPSTAG